MNNIKILIYGLLLLISVQTSYAQTSANIPAKFSKEQLIGKKWTKSTTIDSSQKKIVNKHGKITMGSKNVTIGVGADFSLSYVFDKDSVTLTATVNGEPIVMRYAYYLSDSFECDFKEIIAKEVTYNKNKSEYYYTQEFIDELVNLDHKDLSESFRSHYEALDESYVSKGEKRRQENYYKYHDDNYEYDWEKLLIGLGFIKK